jgi:predicted O-methyltransferase YrrM
MKQVRILLWFLARPRYWRYFAYFVWWRLRNLFQPQNRPEDRAQAMAWCEHQAVERDVALRQVIGTEAFPAFEEQFRDVLEASRRVTNQISIPMGGAGDMELLYQLAEHLQATRVIETGVAFGWSSLAILLSLRNRPDAKLVSTDLAYPGRNSEQYVGCAVPLELQTGWIIVPYPDRQALPRALKLLPQIDLCHYDSDKTHEGRDWAYPRLWRALRSGGMLVSDDIGDNLAFRDFCAQIGQTPMIYRYKSKYIGLMVKP